MNQQQPVIHEKKTSALSKQIQENKTLIIALVVVAIGGGYFIFDFSGEDGPLNDPELNAQLAELQANQPNTNTGATASFDGTDQRNVSIGSGGSGEASPGVFRTDNPVIEGILVGYGTKSDFKGEYLIAYVAVPDTPGYEVDLREVLGYETQPPMFLSEGNRVRVYGTRDRDNTIIAEAIL